MSKIASSCFGIVLSALVASFGCSSSDDGLPPLAAAGTGSAGKPATAGASSAGASSLAGTSAGGQTTASNPGEGGAAGVASAEGGSAP